MLATPFFSILRLRVSSHNLKQEPTSSQDLDTGQVSVEGITVCGVIE